MMDKTNPEKAVKELTMLLMYLTRFNEKGRFASGLDWPGRDMILTLLMNLMRKIISGREAAVPSL
jgi:hypothetical protein